MSENSYKGKFIVFDGIDGSGKTTQRNLLIERFKKENYDVKAVSFPQYGTKSAGLLEEYLSGKYGNDQEVGPYRASIFYACDRYDASFKIKEWLSQGKILVSNRYVSSNIGHQGGKIKDIEKRKEFIRWLYALEYEIFGIPKPDITFILKTSANLCKKMAAQNIDREVKKQAYLGDKERDIHENLEHLSNALDSYIMASEEFPNEFQVIDCLENNEFLAPEIIHQKIFEIVKNKLLK
ncbi:MAG: dTMP kinase [Candidatus Pacebacteria bacterium]|nr:dTMP kinase [Candidatus Paceibacterota bacterium]